MLIRTLVALLSTSAAYADEIVHLEPAPTWVAAIPVPARAADATSEALSLRLFDRQMRFDAAGNSQFARSVFRVGSAEALAAAGQVALQWQPATDRLAVHKLIVHRDGKAIDVLARGQSFTILRREDGLAAAQIDGRLTATLQISDLRVGDEVEIAATTVSTTPLLAGHGEDILALQGGAGIDRFHLLYRWPTARALRWQLGEALPAAASTVRGGERTLTIDRANFVMPVVPRGAPARFMEIGAVQVADFADWQSVSVLFADLYGKASMPAAGSPLAAEIARIAAASPDPRRRAELALQLVQREVRYFADLQGLGNYRPVAADRVWAERFGDCKGKSVLLTAMLRGLGIEAVPALVSATRGNGLDKSLPMPGRFDHVIVRATIAGKTYWLDGTRTGDTALDRVDVPAFEWALPLTAPGSRLEALVATPPTQPTEENRLDLDATAGILVPAKASGSVTWRGDMATAYKAGWAFVPAAQRDAWLREFWKGRHKSVDVTTARFDSDPASGTATISFTGTTKMDWSVDSYRSFELSESQIGYDLTPERAPGRFADAPVAIAPDYTVRRRTILLPDKGTGFTLDGTAIDTTVAGVSFKRTATLTNGRVEMVASMRAAAHEIPFAAAKAADVETDAMYKKRLFVRIGHGYLGTPADLAAFRALPAPEGATPLQAAILQAAKLLVTNDPKGALALLDRSAADGAKSAPYHATRAWVLLQLQRASEADAAVDRALTLDSRNIQAMAIRAARLRDEGKYEDALILHDRAILIDPDNVNAYAERAETRRLARNFDGAIADAALVLDRNPDNLRMRWVRSWAFMALRQLDKALGESDTMIAAQDDASTRALRGNIYAILKRDAEARTELARSIALEPSGDAYLTRLTFELSDGATGTLADVVALLDIEPLRGIPERALRRAMTAPGAADRIIAAFDKALVKNPGNAAIVEGRTSALEAAGRHDQALAQYDKWLAAADTDDKRATALNSRCWYRATNNIDLRKALADCDAAVKLVATAAHYDSRALVHFRLGDTARALADYDLAIADNPKVSASHFGRGLVKQQIGDAKGAAIDFAAARALYNRVDENFGWMGLVAKS